MQGGQGDGARIATTSDIGHWFRNDRDFCKGCGGAGRCGHRPLRRGYKECGTRPGGGLRAARPTSLILYGETGGVEPRPYGSQGGRWGGPMWASAPTEGYKESGTRPGGRTGASARCIVFSRLGASHIKKALCYDAGIIAKGFFILDCAYLTSSMMAVSAASPRRTPVRTMRV